MGQESNEIPVKDTPNGESADLAEASHEATELQVLQKRLQESEQRYRALFVDHIDAVITTDRDGYFLFANPAFEKMSRTPVKNLEKTHFLLHVLPELQDFTMGQYRKAMDGQSVEYDTKIINESQKIIDLHVMLIPVVVGDEVQEIHCVAKDITKVRKAQRDLERMAFTHHLTGIANRNALDEHLRILTQRGSMFAVLNLDVERMKAVNDLYGRNVGDLLLKAVAKRLNGYVKTPSRLFHSSGGNFVIVHAHQRDEEIFNYVTVIEDILSAPFSLADQDMPVSFSIGVCAYPQYGREAESLMRRSEDAMIAAKKRGRRHIAFYRELIQDDESRMNKIEFALRHALTNNNFSLMYQPQVDAHNGEVHGIEALLRWEHPEYGPISPVEFIPIAERTGLIHDLGLWVIEEACRQLHHWELSGLVNLRIGVNVSIDQFYDTQFIGRLEHIVRSSGIVPQSLVIEVTESIAANADTVLQQLHELKNLGVGIAIDDFGTGYSSLRYLRDFPADYLKIDRSFISRIEEHESDRKLVTTVIELARHYNLSTVAEGVETSGQMQILQEIGVEFLQGYHIGRPMTSDRFEQWLLSWQCRQR